MRTSVMYDYPNPLYRGYDNVCPYLHIVGLLKGIIPLEPHSGFCIYKRLDPHFIANMKLMASSYDTVYDNISHV